VYIIRNFSNCVLAEPTLGVMILGRGSMLPDPNPWPDEAAKGNSTLILDAAGSTLSPLTATARSRTATTKKEPFGISISKTIPAHQAVFVQETQL
jgi:hypothetical protein